MMKRIWPVLVSLGIVGSACGGGTGPRSIGASGGGAVRIEMTNFAFSPSHLTLRAGQRVTLQLENMSPIEHEFMAGRDPMTMGGYTTDLFKGIDVQAKGGTTEHGGHSGGFELKVPPHMGRAELTFVVPDRKGSYEIGCFLPGHYEAGMKATLNIE